MKSCFVIAVFALIWDGCGSRVINEAESVVSVYNSQSDSAHTNVYSQIANNLAEKITSPLYNFFGISNSTDPKKRPFEHIELQDPEPSSNTTDRDVEELSAEALRKTETKPEKITLFTRYLPASLNMLNRDMSKLENLNETNELDSELDNEFDNEFDFDDEETPRGSFVYVLELIGSIIQLLWGGFLAFFNPSTTTS